MDYPREALAFFAPDKAMQLDDSVTITPVRQEQLKDRLSDRFYELDAPLLVTWPDGRRGALIFVMETESVSRVFSPHRLAVYCLQVAQGMETDRVVPVVIFLNGRPHGPDELVLGGDRHRFLRFRYLACVLNELHAEDHLDSSNIVARIVLPLMLGLSADKVEICHAANAGVLSLPVRMAARSLPAGTMCRQGNIVS